jgi:predicted secreted Zn-dependent protease
MRGSRLPRRSPAPLAYKCLRMIGQIFLAAASAALTVEQARADVTLNISYSSYWLRGLSREAIRADLGRKARRDGDAVIEGETKVHFYWDLDLVDEDDFCRVSRDRIILTVDILLPVWADEERSNQAVRAAWTSYYRKLKEHEEGHKEVAVVAAKRITKLFHGASMAGSCSALERSLGRAAKRIIEAAERQQEMMDSMETPFQLE